MTTWTINGRFLSQPVTGVQRYAREVTAAIDTALCDDAALQSQTVEILVPPATRDAPVYKRIPIRTVGHLSGQLWEQLELPRHARGPLLSLANTGPILKRDQIVCLHDANTRVIPQSYSPAFRLAYRILHPALGRVARSVTTVSRHAATDLTRFRIAPRNKISVAYNGADHAARWRPRHTPETAAISGPATIVLLGSRAPHKNAGLILDLAPQLALEGFRVAVVGMSASVFAEETKASLHPAVTLLGRIDDDALAALLRDSLCLAFPSLTEGFGLPPLEAMTHGCPVVASTAASIPEVCGDAAIYADPLDAAAWLAAFSQLRTGPSLRRTMIARGHERVRNFTWARTARLYIAALQNLKPITEALPNQTLTRPHSVAPPVHTFPD